jgi:hypothetical protein
MFLEINMSAWKSPQSIFNLGHRAVKDLFSVPVQIQEKVDGSFFAFGLFPELEPMDRSGYLVETGNYELKVRSKGAVMITDAPEALFKLAVKAVNDRQRLLRPGWQYRGETLAKPKHNSLSYDRTPKDNIILFDILTDEETYLPYEDMCAEAARLDLEVVPQLFSGTVNNAEELRRYLETTSILGGQKIEGVVVKPLTPLYGPDKKMLFGKFVSEAFKEVHRKAWGESNPGPKDIIIRLGEQYANGARYQKALIHLREAGEIEDSPRDIGKLIREIPADVRKECSDEIKEALFKYAWPHISRIVVREVPTWYKDQLLRMQFEKEAINPPEVLEGETD